MTDPINAPIDIPADIPASILFACTHNKIRSPMAEALMKAMYSKHITYIDSCGIDDGGDVGDGFTIATMREISIDLLDHTPKSFDDLKSQHFDLVICFSEASYEAACHIPSLKADQIEYWPIYDPQLIAEGREARLTAYRNIRDQIKHMLTSRFGPANE